MASLFAGLLRSKEQGIGVGLATTDRR